MVTYIRPTKDVARSVTKDVTHNGNLDKWIENHIKQNPQISLEELAKLCKRSSKTIKLTEFFQMTNVGDGIIKDVTSNVTSLSLVQLTDKQKEISKMMLNNPCISVKEMSLVLSLAERTIKRGVAAMQKMGVLVREGNTSAGHWVVIKEKE